MKTNGRRLGALLLALVMVLSLVPGTALAARMEEDEISIDAPDIIVDEAQPAGAVDNSAELFATVTEPTGIEDTTLVSVDDMTPTGPAPYSGEELPKLKDSESSTHYGSTANFTNEAERYVQIELPNAIWLSGLYWMNRGASNGAVTKYAVLASCDGTHWSAITDNRDGTAWVKTANTWNTAQFPHAVKAKYIKVLGVETQSNYISCAELRLAAPNTTPTTRNVAVTVKSSNTSSGLAGATVVVGGQVATTNESGVATVENLIANQAYTATVSAEDHAAGTVEIAADATSAEITLQGINRTITGKVVDNEGNNLEGATVTLVSNNTNVTTIANTPSAETGSDGTFSMNVNTLAAGTYKVRAAKAGYGAAISGGNTVGQGTVTIEATELTETKALADNITLTEIDTTSATTVYTYDMSSESSRPILGRVIKDENATDEAAKYYVPVEWTDDGQMKLKFSYKDTTANSDNNGTNKTRPNNIVTLVDTKLKNGTVEFDATRSNYSASSPGRFGLALRLKDQNNWIYLGLENTDSKWFHERWNGEASHSGGWSGTVTGPSFNNNETRHFKASINGFDDNGTEKIKISLYVDGIPLFEEKLVGGDSYGTGPLEAADVGIVCGNGIAGQGLPCDIAIDNLYILRQDPAQEMTLTDPAQGGTLAAVIKRDTGNVEIHNNQVAVGDTVQVTGTPSNSDAVLDAITVTPTNEGETISNDLKITRTEENVFTFIMPEVDVTVTGTFLPKVTGVTIEGDKKVGKTLTATVEPSAAEGHVTYQWYHLNNEGQDGEAWVACTNATGKTKTVDAADEGKKVKVVVTGNGADYAQTVTAEAGTTETMAPADVETTAVIITRDQITMWVNCDTDPNTNDNKVEGKTTTLTATVQPSNATNQTIVWTSSDENVATVTANADNTSATLTAVANGTATIKAEVTSADGTKVSDTIAITVQTQVTGVTMNNLTDNKVIVYTNTDHTNHSANVTATVAPATASNKTLVWTRPEGAQGMIRLDRNGSSETTDEGGEAESSGNGVTITAIGGETNVGTVTVEVKSKSDPTKKQTFTVEVRRKLADDHNITIAGGTAPKFGDTLTVNTDQLVMTTEGKQALSYQWKRTKGGSTENIGNAIVGDAGKTYTLVEADVGATISVEVTADVTKFYEGTKTATTAEVVKADGPTIPGGTIVGVKTTTADNNDGKITGFTDGITYEYRPVTDPETENWTEVTGTQVTGLTNGNYNVRVKETATHKAGTAITVTVAAYDEDFHQITVATMTNGTVTRSVGQAGEGTVITLTVQPNAGYELETLTVNKASGTVELTTVTEGTSYTFEMPAENVTVNATFKLRKVTITHALSNGLTCSLTEHDENGNHVVDYGTVHSITLTVDDSHTLPTSIKVTKTGTQDELGNDAVTYRDGVITFPNGVTEDITITATAAVKKYTVQWTLTEGVLTGSGDAEVNHGTTFNGTLNLTNTVQYERPTEITVTMGGTTLAAGTGYTYDSATGAITISNVTGNVVITASGVRKTTPVESVSISGDTIVDSTLSTTVSPEGAQVRYQWFRGDAEISGATSSTYKLTADDLGKMISVKVTGYENYSGEKTSAAVGPVEAKVVAATGITLDKSTADIEFGKTVQLTATVAPADATDKSVTWDFAEGSSTDVVSVDANGLVTALKVGTATVRATDSAGHTATCVVTVTAAQVSVTLSGVAQEGQTLTAKVSPDGATTRSILWYRVGAGAEGADLLIESNNDQTTYTLTTEDVGYKIKVTVEGSGNYTGTDAATTATAVVSAGAELPSYTVTVSDAITNGTVTADKAEAKAGEVVTLTVEPDAGYVLDELTVTGTDVVEVTDNTFVMPAENVTVTATFKKIEVTGVTLPATASVTVGKTTTLTAVLAPEGAVGTLTWTSGNEEAATVDENGVVTGVAEGEAIITVSVDGTDFTATCTVSVNKASSSGSTSRPTSNGTSTSTVTNPDGSTTTTVTKPDGSKTVTTEKPDGSKEVVETKKDGTVTETVTDTEGAKTEKVTTPEGDKTITVTDAEGEELAKVELPATVGEPEETFEDIEEHWAKESINKVAALGLVNGVGENKYGAEAPMTRGSLATVLYRLSNGKGNYRVSFNDVEIGKYYTEGVAWATKANVVKGISEELFAPEEIITREQLAVMMARYAKLVGLNTTADTEALNAFVDGDKTGDWAVDGVSWCVENGILQGRGESVLDPTANVNRAEVAVMLDRFIELLK